MAEAISQYDERATSAGPSLRLPEDDRKRILFVDDEPDLLESLRDALRRYRRVWRVDFAKCGEGCADKLGEL
jgi:CheY-like chemotaxis protein